MKATVLMNLHRIMLSEKKPFPNGYILYNSVYFTFWNDKISKIEKWMVDAKGKRMNGMGKWAWL